MRRASIVVAAVALVLPASAVAGRKTQPALRILDLTPASIHGVHFKAGERVGVTIVAGNSRFFRKARASGSGSFTVVFGTITRLGSCTASISLVALGAGGDRAAIKLPRVSCPAGAPPTPTTTTPGTSSGYLAPPPPYTT